MEFVLNIDVNKFRSTNALWNNLMLNAPWSVGYVTTLIELESFEKKEDWESFYYESGRLREFEVSKLNSDYQNLLNDESLIRTNRNIANQLDWNLKNLNTQYGRTKECLRKKGFILFTAIKNNKLGLTLEDCIECVRFRVICETWNGVIIRERNTIENLQRKFPEIYFKKVSGEIDFAFAVDYELYKNGSLVCAIQIKPRSYTWNTSYINKARKANKYKNEEYFKKFGVRVFDVISNSRGEIINTEVLKNL